jgi:hypothetical protein
LFQAAVKGLIVPHAADFAARPGDLPRSIRIEQQCSGQIVVGRIISSGADIKRIKKRRRIVAQIVERMYALKRCFIPFIKKMGRRRPS